MSQCDELRAQLAIVEADLATWNSTITVDAAALSTQEVYLRVNDPGLPQNPQYSDYMARYFYFQSHQSDPLWAQYQTLFTEFYNVNNDAQHINQDNIQISEIEAQMENLGC